MHKKRILFALLLLVVSVFSIPGLNLLDAIIIFMSTDTTVISLNIDNNVVDANPRMIQTQREIYHYANSIDGQIWHYLILLELLLVSLGGIYIALSMLIRKAAPKLLLIAICLVFLFTQGAPWDVATLFKGVNSYESLVSRLNMLWRYDSAIRWFVTSCLFGTFYLVTAVVSAAHFFRGKPPKVM